MLLVANVCTTLYSKQPLFILDQSVQEELVQEYKDVDVVRSAFRSYKNLSKQHGSSVEVMYNQEIQQLINECKNGQISIAQCGMIAQLYGTVFLKQVARLLPVLKKIMQIKQSLDTELFFRRLPAMHRPLKYFVCNEKRKHEKNQQSLLFKNIEQEVAGFLGKCLYGYGQLDSIYNVSNMKMILQQSLEPLGFKSSMSIQELVSGLSYVEQQGSALRLKAKQAIEKNKTYFSAEVELACFMTVALAVVYAHMSSKKIEEVPSIKRSMPVFIKADELSRKKLYKLYQQQASDLVNIKTPGAMAKEQAVILKDKTVQIAQNIVQGVEKKYQAIKAFCKMAAMCTCLYVGGKYSAPYITKLLPLYTLFWKYHVRQMNQQILEIDRLLSEPSRHKIDFATEAKLYCLVLSLKDFIYCLSSDEYGLFHEDIKSLLSSKFDKTYKQQVIKKMYQRYDCLKDFTTAKK